MKTVEELENELEELKKEFYFFTKNGSGGSTPSVTPPSSNDDGWTTIYDMTSTDPALNLGKTTGIHGRDGYIEPLPDLMQFNKIRLRFSTNNATQVYDFDIYHNKDFNGMRILQHNGLGSHIIAVTTSLEIQNGKGVFFVGRFRDIALASSQYPILSDFTSKDEYVRIEMIAVK